MVKKILDICGNRFFQISLITILIVYQMARLIAFVNTYGGIIHDGGWFLSVARSLAETGNYATMTNTMVNPTVQTGLDMNQEFFQMQGDDGRIYFFTEGTVGPTQIFPDAIIIKIFGSGFWQFRAASLLFYLLFLIVTSWLLFLMGGFWAVFLFQATLFFYPHLSVFLGFEALGEVAMIVCILLTFIFFSGATTIQKNRYIWFFVGGLCAGLAILSKIIALLALSSISVLWLILFFQKKSTLKDGLIFFAGFIVLPLVWELVRLITIVYLFGFEAYTQHMQQGLIFFARGSGIEGQNASDRAFYLYKLFRISEISHPSLPLSLLSLIIVAVGGISLIWYFRNKQRYQYLIALIWGGWLIHTLWFVARAETGGVRRYWVALILAVLIFSLVWGTFLRLATQTPGWLTISLAVFMTLLIGINFHSQRHAITVLMSDQLVDYWHQKHLSASRTQLPWIIIPRAEQKAAVTALQHLPDSARIFYVEGYKSPEMAVLSGQIIYPLERRPLMQPVEEDVVLISPGLISPWAKLYDKPMTVEERNVIIDSMRQDIKQRCPDIIFENDYYMICSLD